MQMQSLPILPENIAYGEAFDRVCRERDRMGAVRAMNAAFNDDEAYEVARAAHAAIVAEADAAGKAAMAAFK